MPSDKTDINTCDITSPLSSLCENGAIFPWKVDPKRRLTFFFYASPEEQISFRNSYINQKQFVYLKYSEMLSLPNHH